ncbi:hypothetical protein PRK78_007193 [Emydomyces testavorans]|uniref:Glycosyltransferase family 69 protein n=1 Tax=Emydomyces testavorans TaxID=2070801 RepID=A0AAF0DR12_9EURO|nr:hypothetical protein PRK78_007193 [Emydomyces testavorans]
MESARLLPLSPADTTFNENTIGLPALYEQRIFRDRHNVGSFGKSLWLQLRWLLRRCRTRIKYQSLLFNTRRTNLRRSSACSWLLWFSRIALYFATLFVLVSAFEAVFYPSYQNPPKHYDTLRQKIVSSYNLGRGNVHNEKVFIAANIVDEKMIRGPWSTALVKLIEILGEENVFVSIYQNDSGNGTSTALNELREHLLCNSSIVTGDHLPLSQFPTVILPNGERRTKRIAYLAEVRNRALKPLDPSYSPRKNTNGFQSTSAKFDKILFLNDVYFSPIDAAQLLFSTNADSSGRARYRAACAIDFTSIFKFYDTFVVRDTEGNHIGTPFFPWFSTAGKSESRRDVLDGKDAVRVRSCWGGMVAFDAHAFQRPSASFEGTHALSLRFRHEPEPFWEAAECCLLFADMEQQLGMPAPNHGSGVFINPYIRVAYSPTTWEWMRSFWRYERVFTNFQYIVNTVFYRSYNPRRLHNPGQLVKEKVWVTDTQKPQRGSFQMLERLAAPGGFCGQRAMFVMQKDVEAANSNGSGKNWEEIEAP